MHGSVCSDHRHNADNRDNGERVSPLLISGSFGAGRTAALTSMGPEASSLSDVPYSMSALPVARRRRLLPQHESADHRPETPCCGQRFDMTTGEDMQGRVRNEASQDPCIRDRNDRIGIDTP